EEHAIMGGAGSAVNEFMAQEQIVKPIINLGLPDSFLHQATHNQMLQDCGLDAKGILNSIERAWPALVPNVEIMREAALRGFSTATDLADYLVKKGVAFRDA
ncbi:hypothetical protein RZN32_32210, partial [Klebsiella pneumoniae]|nr:hypothetical protein [Klebsiella pneumoniae]